MRLIYVYIGESGPLRDVELNFCADVRCGMVGETLEVERQAPLPKHFYKLRSCRREQVTSVSAIVGENGAGKTSVAEFLARACAETVSGDYLIVTEDQGKNLRCYGRWERWALRLDPAFGSAIKGRRPPFRLIYLSPHYSLGRRIEPVKNRVIDLSTNGLLRDCHDKNRLPDSLADYECQQIKWMLEWARILHDKSDEECRNAGLRLPRGVTISLDQRAIQAGVRRFAFFKSDKQKGGANIDGALYDFYLYAFFGYVASLEEYREHSGRPRPVRENIADLIAFADSIDAELCKKDHLSKLDAFERIRDYLETIPKGRNRALSKVRQVRRFFGRLAEILDAVSVEDCARDHSCIRIAFSNKKVSNAVLHLVALHAICEKAFDILRFGLNPLMSSGEMAYMSMWGRLNWFFSRQHGKAGRMLVFLDEAETTLHPSWQRRLVMNMIWYFSNFTSGKIHVVFATHSPFLLSDIPGGQACFLEYEVQEDGGHGLVRSVFDDTFKDSFASNFYDLYRLPFVLPEGPVGAFAQEKIDDLLDRVKSGELLDDDRALAELVGDRIVRGYLKEKMAQFQLEVK